MSETQLDTIASLEIAIRVMKNQYEKLCNERDRLNDLVEQLTEHCEAKTGDTVQDEQWDDVWHLAYPDDSSWEYPGQVIREVRAAFERLTKQRQLLEDLHKHFLNKAPEHYKGCGLCIDVQAALTKGG